MPGPTGLEETEASGCLQLFASARRCQAAKLSLGLRKARERTREQEPPPPLCKLFCSGDHHRGVGIAVRARALRREELQSDPSAHAHAARALNGLRGRKSPKEGLGGRRRALSKKAAAKARRRAYSRKTPLPQTCPALFTENRRTAPRHSQKAQTPEARFQLFTCKLRVGIALRVLRHGCKHAIPVTTLPRQVCSAEIEAERKPQKLSSVASPAASHVWPE